MSDDELEKIRRQKLENYMKLQSMPQGIIKIHTPQEYEQLINEHPSAILIIDFWAEWCGPCKNFAPVFEKLQNEYGNEFIFAKVDVDENGSLAQRFGITGIPTTVFIQNGNLINKVVGAMGYNGMKNVLEKLKS
ncbi:MAG: Thioredoxin [Promethearchaeota archaeon]|nr:MAG: Thioredoxin [Candidatus Lokiarchaeota archaeon]